MSSREKRSSLSLRNHYSRFLECFDLQSNAFDNVSCKSDQWIMQFIEDCYEDAVQSCDKANDSNSDNCINVDRPNLGMITVVAIYLRGLVTNLFFNHFLNFCLDFNYLLFEIMLGHRIHPTYFLYNNCERIQIAVFT